MTHLFSPLRLRELTLRNRIAISPMCTYSATDGVANDFHLAHYGRFALGGAGLVMLEATATAPEGRISHGDLGLWDDAQIEPLARIASLVKAQGGAVGIQLCHAGRKAARQRPWHGNGPLGAEDLALRGESGWPLVSPSAIPFGADYETPSALEETDISAVMQQFVDAAGRANAAGFDVVELHVAHGFLLHSFMSPVTNHREDAFGGDFQERHRFPLQVVAAVRQAWPADHPLFARVSALDGVDGGRSFDETLAFSRELGRVGVDVIDCSSGGIGGHSASTAGGGGPRSYGFQLPYAERIRRETGVASMAVGLITEPELADSAIADGRADLIAIGRQALVNPNWPLHAEAALGRHDPAAPFQNWPEQYGWWLNGRQKIINAMR
ncbi:NADH:flavin oxidoreductase/NADH oxidase [Ottowia thiooxydans]|uniref:NADH:flavin oxidoreductase/NADH oxidase n=1 Tax=Ottowia thiooxydans TaxID=219182 RepID=UPI0004019B60|nr:NADH:flavin oxidoreductase/NADH oxidase [Ottowia thiooxydans]